MRAPSILRLLLPIILVATTIIPMVIFGEWQTHRTTTTARLNEWTKAADSTAGLLMANPLIVTELRDRRLATSPLHFPLYGSREVGTDSSDNQIRANIAIDIDGTDHDWPTPSIENDLPPYWFGGDHLLEVNQQYEPDSLRFSLRMLADPTHLFLLFSVVDDRVIYQQLESVSAHRNDYIQLAFPTPHQQPERLQRMTISAFQPGPANVFELSTTSLRALRENPDVYAYWAATEEGYRVEMAVPRHMLGTHLGINITDVDDDQQRTRRYVIGPSSTRHLNEQSALFSPIAANITGLEYSPSSNAAIYDAHGYLVACTDRCPSLMRSNHLDYQVPLVAPDDASIPLGYLLLRRPDGREPFSPRLPWLVGSLIFVIALLMVNFHRRMQRELNDVAVDYTRTVAADGHITDHEIQQGTRPIREIESLRSALFEVNRRLSEHYDYTQEMPNRLAHELRTPVSVVQSSLDNLQDVSESSEIFVQRARDGIATLIDLIQRMTEASRLEQALEPSEQRAFALEDVIRGLIESYRTIHPQTTIEMIGLEDNAGSTTIFGLPELIAQLLDKILNNAVDFATNKTPVRVRLTRESGHAVIRISNEGPTLPPGDPFSPMKSSRPTDPNTNGSDLGVHLGLGLYIARMIARFHGGQISAADRLDTEGVTVTLSLPIARMTANI
ncbi:MAG: ATP-binding protein [Pseudomonadota bacterium]